MIYKDDLKLNGDKDKDICVDDLIYFLDKSENLGFGHEGSRVLYVSNDLKECEIVDGMKGIKISTALLDYPGSRDTDILIKTDVKVLTFFKEIESFVLKEMCVTYKKVFGMWVNDKIYHKKVVHKMKPIPFHVGSVGFLYKDNGMILIQKRCSKKKVYPGCWDFSFAEHMKSYENNPLAENCNFVESVIRAIQEENNLRIDKKQIKQVGGLYEHHGKYDRILVNTYVIKVDNDLEITLSEEQLQEVEKVVWVNKEELKDLLNKRENFVDYDITSWLDGIYNNNKELQKWIDKL